jgi:hypothetical protein
MTGDLLILVAGAGMQRVSSIGKNVSGNAVAVIMHICKCFSGQKQRSDLDALLSSGLFNQLLGSMDAFERGGAENVDKTNVLTLVNVLTTLRCTTSHPDCEAGIRSVGSSIAFAMEHSLTLCEDLGFITGGLAAQIACAVFGRDEMGTSEFTFTQMHVDIMVAKWSDYLMGTGVSGSNKPTSDYMQALELCISDQNKPLLLSNSDFFPYLINGLFLVRGLHNTSLAWLFLCLGLI